MAVTLTSFGMTSDSPSLFYAGDRHLFWLTHPTLKGALEALLEPVVATAIGACRAANDLAVDAADAQDELLRAETDGHFWIEPLRERAQALTLKTAELLIEAYTRSEEAEGVARAVRLAGRGVPWTPRNCRADEEALLALGRGA